MVGAYCNTPIHRGFKYIDIAIHIRYTLLICLRFGIWNFYIILVIWN